MKLIFGTRGSKLALHQTNHVIETIKTDKIKIKTKIIKTLGDKVTNLPLFKVGGQGLFIKEIEKAMLAKEIDIAVHSLKDLPHKIEDGLSILAVGIAKDPRDCFLSNKYPSLSACPAGAKIGTSSLRRRAQISVIRKDLQFTDFRGNLDTRLKKLEEGEVDAIVLAVAGLERFSWEDKIAQYFSVKQLTPPAGQGLLAIQCRTEDIEKLTPYFAKFADKQGAIRAEAERAFLAKLQGGCQTPMGVYAKVTKNKIELFAFVGKPDGSKFIRKKLIAPTTEPTKAGTELAEMLIKEGANEFLVKPGETNND